MAVAERNSELRAAATGASLGVRFTPNKRTRRCLTGVSAFLGP